MFSKVLRLISAPISRWDTLLLSAECSLAPGSGFQLFLERALILKKIMPPETAVTTIPKPRRSR